MGLISNAVGRLVAVLASASGGSTVKWIQVGVGAVLRSLTDKAREFPSLGDYGGKGDGVFDNYDAIERALAAHQTVYVPPGLWMTSAGAAGKPSHKITGKTLIGLSREVSIIQALGANSGRTLFVNDKTDAANPGTWGSGKDFRIEKLWIRGNWDGVTGKTLVNGKSIGLLQGAYDAAANTALVKGVSAAYANIVNSYVDNAFEHGVMFFRTGYSEISGNIFARCRGSALWLLADSAANGVTSLIVERNQFIENVGGFGALKTLYTYGCAIRDNRPFEGNSWGMWIGEGADLDVSGNYCEANFIGDAAIDASVWGLSLVNNYWTIAPDLPAGFAARGFFGYDRKIGLRHYPAPGLGETDNRLGPVRYSCDSTAIGVGVAPAASGTGLTFPAVQVPSTNADTLDDYKERTVQIADGSVASLGLTGNVIQTKIGRVVTVSGQVTFPANASGADITLTGIPQVGAVAGAGVMVDNAGIGASAIMAPAGGTSFTIYPAGSFVNRKNSDFSGKVVYFTLTYNGA